MPAASGIAHEGAPERQRQLVACLSSDDTSTKLKALRDLKNQIIGNKSRKLDYINLGAVPRYIRAEMTFFQENEL